MKKLLTFLLTALLAFGVGWAETATLTMSSQGWSTGSLSNATTNVTIDDVTFSLQKGSANNIPYYDGTYLRFYSNSKLVISCASSITSIQIIGGNNSYPVSNFSASVGSYSNGTWTGNANEITFTVSRNRAYVKEIVVTYSSGSAEPNWYRKVMSESDLVAGKKCIFVYENGSSSAAMGALANGSGTGITGLSLTDNRINIGGSSVSEFTLGGTSNAWTFLNSDSRYLGATSASSESFATSATLGGYTDLRWTIGSDGTIRNNQYTTKYIRCNSIPNFGLFSSGNYAYIYVQDLEDCAAPTFSPDGGSSTSGSLDVTISSATEGATIYYTTDNTDPVVNRSTSSIANGGTVHLTESCTIKALAAKSGMDNSTIVTSQSYSISSSGDNIYRKVTSSDDFVDGKKYILVYEDTPAFMGAISTTSTKYGLSITGPSITNNKVNIAGYADIKELTLTKDGDNLSFHNGDGYLCWISGNSLNVEENISNKSKWTASGDASSGFTLTNVFDTSRELKYNSTSGQLRFACYTSGMKRAVLYVQDSTDPELSVNPNELSINVPYNQSSATATFTVTGSNLTSSNVSVSVSGEDFSVSPTSIAVADGSVNQDVTVTYNGTSTTPVTGTVTVTSGDLSQTVTVTAQKELPPPPTMTVSTNSLTVGASGNSFNVTAANLTEALTVTTSTGFSVNPTSLATDATYPAAVNVTYTGQALSATGNVTVSNTADNLTETVNVTYVYDGNMYIVGDVNNTSWDFVNGVPMTRNQDGTYSAHVTAQANGWYNGVQYAWLYFTKAVGSEAIVAANAFGPQGGDQWGMTPNLYGQWCDLDQNGDVNTIYMNSGSYEIVVDPVNNKFKITPDVASPVITPATGTYHEAQEVTITCSTPGATIYYTTDGTTPTTSSSVYNGPFTVDATTVVTAIAVSNGLTSDPATSSITIKLPGEGDFYLVTDAADLADGNEIIFVNSGTATSSALAMSTEQKANNRGTTQVAVTSALTVEDIYEDMQIAVLEGDDANGWYFNVGGDNADAYLYAASSSSNYLRTTNDKTDNNAKATIEITEAGVATILFQGSNTHNSMRFNGEIVSCYASGQSPVYIYKRGTARPSIKVEPATMELVIPAGETSQQGTATVTERNTTETTVVTITGDGASHFSATLENGTLTVTYNGTATADTPDAATITLTNGTATADVNVTGYKMPMTVTITPINGTTFTGNCMENVTISSNVNGATIEYSFDGTTWQTYNGAFSTPEVSDINGTVTVYARATYNGETVTSQATYTRVEASSTLFTKVKSLDQIAAGNQYIIVYENADVPQALNGVNGGGTGATVAWDTPNSVIDIDNTNVIPFTLDGDAASATLSYVSGSTTYYLEAGNPPSLDFAEGSPTVGYDWSIDGNETDGYYLQWTNSSNQTYTLRYNTGMSNTDRFRLYTGSTGQIAYLYVQGNAVATPKITPASGGYPSDQNVNITCATTGATIYYTVNGGEQQTYTAPFTVELNENQTTATVVAWAEKNGVTSNEATATYTYSIEGWVNNIAEFLALGENEEASFKNPVVVLFDYSQNGNQDYIWVKDRTGYMKLFIQPGFDSDTSEPRYNNGDVIPEGFTVKKIIYTEHDAEFVEGKSEDPSLENFKNPTERALADPEQVKLSELLANPAYYNDRYLYINKLEITGHSGTNYTVASDENGDGTSEVSGNNVIIYNKFPTWKEKNGTGHTVNIPDADGTYYNVTFIFQKYGSVYEIMPVEFSEWVDNSIRLEDLVKVTETGGTYTISNDLHAVKVTWDDNKGKFAIFAKDDEMYANMRKPLDGQETYLIRYQNGNFINSVEQEDYDQSNWIEILIPSTITDKLDGGYQGMLDAFKGQFENKILPGGSIQGTYVDALNPTIEYNLSTLPNELDKTSAYKPNIYTPANFLLENIDDTGDEPGAKSYRDDVLGEQLFFMMDGKPQEMGMVVWCYYPGSGDYFFIPERAGDQVNGHRFHGNFKADMSLCEDANVSTQHGSSVESCYPDASNELGDDIEQVALYGFNAIVRKNPAYNWTGRNGAPRRVDVVPYEDGMEKDADGNLRPAFIIYPINAAANATGTVTAVAEFTADKAVESVRYYNMMGMESKTPFEGINIVVTRYTDGSTSTTKILR